MNVMPIAGKSPTNTAVGFKVDADGTVNAKRVWNVSTATVLAATEIRDTNAIATDNLDLSDAGMVSLRIKSTLDQPVTIQLYNDIASTYLMLDANGDSFDLTVSSTNSKWMVITDRDWTCLNYLSYLKLRIQASAAPTSGGLVIMAVIKK